MPLDFDYPQSELDKNIDAIKEKLPIAVMMYATTKASQLQAIMKLNRPWTDRTGMAKTMLTAKASKVSPTLTRITLAHGVNYGIWLELAHEKNWAIIAPTVNEEGPKVMNDLQNLLSKIQI